MENIVGRIWTRLGMMKLLNFVPNKVYLKIAYFLINHKKLNLHNPKTFSDKLNWLKLYYRDENYYKIVDKAEFKAFVDEKIGSGYTVKTYYIYDSVDKINFEELPNSFVIKCTHDSHSVFIIKNKNNINKKKILVSLKKHMKKNLYYYAKEWPYKKVKPRIIVEELLNPSSNDTFLIDYKWFCFNGEPRIMYLGKDAGDNPKSAFFDMEYKKIDMKGVDPLMEEIPPMPSHFEEMKDISRKLSKGMPHVRVDFYIDSNDKLYVGEMTFFHSAGLGRFTPEDKELLMGNFIKLPQKK